MTTATPHTAAGLASRLSDLGFQVIGVRWERQGGIILHVGGGEAMAAAQALGMAEAEVATFGTVHRPLVQYSGDVSGMDVKVYGEVW
jgi:hypothetical protein